MDFRCGLLLSTSALLLCGVVGACGSSEGGGDGDGSGGSGSGNGGPGSDLGRLRDQPKAGDTGSLLPLGGNASAGADGGGPELDGGTPDGGSGRVDGGGAGSGSSGSGGSGSGDSGSGGSGSGGDCDVDTYRCTSAGRERCDGSDWVSAPCPLDEPACVSGSCVLRGPTMVKVGSFYIDSTEVTVADYVEFLDARADDTDGQPTVCAWNTSFYAGTPVDPDDWPITYVDWCDAWAYCDWAGKRLCGAIEGGAVDTANALEQTESQWFLACGGSGGNTHPNGSADCNSVGGTDGLDPVGSNTGCEGFYTGLFDMEGNAAEWVDSCASETGASDFCLLLGGSYVDNQSYCTEAFDDVERNSTADPFGFRCCSG